MFKQGARSALVKHRVREILYDLKETDCDDQATFLKPLQDFQCCFTVHDTTWRWSSRRSATDDALIWIDLDRSG